MNTESKVEVLENLRDIQGQKIGLKLADDLAFGDDETLMIMGEAGLGKSTLLAQIRSRIKQLLRGQVHYDHVWFEDAMDITERDYAPPRIFWTASHYKEMSITMSGLLNKQEARRQAFVSTNHDVKWLGLDETVSLGALSIYDRAISSFESRVGQERKTGIFKTKYIAGPADPNSQKRAGEIRTALEEKKQDQYLISNDEVLDYLMDKHNIKVVGVQDFHNPGLLVRAVFQRQARIDRMQEISREVLTGAVIWRNLYREEADSLMASIIIPNDIQLSDEERDIYLLKAAHIEYRWNDLGLPEGKGITVFNVFNPDALIEIDMSPFIRFV